MSDYSKLVKQLKSRAQMQTATGTSEASGHIDWMAADAIEALVRERDEARKAAAVFKCDFVLAISSEARAEALEEAIKVLANRCDRCNGAEWLWAHEISNVGSSTDDTKYGCRDTDYSEMCQHIAAIRALKGATP